MIRGVSPPRSLRLLLSATLLTACSVTLAAAQGEGDYPGSLREVYGAYQAVLARREACMSAFALSRATSEKAYTAWHGRNKALIAELDQRFAMMIRGASRDEREYARNVGKYEGAILKQREEVKQELLQTARPDLESLCQGLPDFLNSAESDLEKAYAEELRVVRRRPLAIR